MLPLGFLNHFGGGEILVVGFIALLLFGKRLPEVMRSLGKSVTEFKKGVSGIEEDMDKAVVTETKAKSTNEV